MKKEENNVGNHPSQCYGCSICEYICPNDAVCLSCDDHGFLYPKIYADKCINCGLCIQACPISKENSFKNIRAKKCYAVKNNDSVRMSSSSGGMYTALTDLIFEMGGVCLGSSYGEDYEVTYGIANNIEERNAQRGSKYVQSYMSPVVLDRLIDIIKDGRIILISGTPCEIAAIKSLLNKKNIKTDNIVFVDIVCHGTPSPEVWRQYLSEIEGTHNSKIKNFTFRDKKKGWRGYHVRIELENGDILEGTNESDSFVNLFRENLILRESCFNCPYASMERCGDLTIGDFWGIEEIAPFFSDNKGISMVFANTENGEKYLSMVLPVLNFKEYSTRVVTQPNMHKPSERSISLRRFWKIYERKGYTGVKEKFAPGGRGFLFYHYHKAIKLRMAALIKELK